MLFNGRTTVLFVSRRGTLRSVLASACLQHLDRDRFRCFAAGAPGAVDHEVHPLAVEALRKAHMGAPARVARSWDGFRRLGAPRLDLVITLDRAVAEQLPIWPGQPDQALWEYPDLLQGPADAPACMAMLLSLRRRLAFLAAITRRQASRADFRSDLREMAYMR